MKKIILTLLCLVFALTLQAAVLYTDKTNATNLAWALYQAKFDGKLITSVSIKRKAKNKYYLKVILQNGNILNWYIKDIYEYAIREKISLKNESILVFPSKESSTFYVFNKKDFYNVVLNSKVYNKNFREDDPLYGRSLYYSIKSFDILPASFNRKNSESQPYKYAVNFFNDERELFTYADAYSAFQQQRFIKASEPEILSLRSFFRITKIALFPLDVNNITDTIPQFSIRLNFNQPLGLEKEHFPLEIYPTDTSDLFTLQITFPNTYSGNLRGKIKNFEYLNNIRFIKDNRYIGRSLLQADFNPEVTDFNPVIEKNASNSIMITFFYKYTAPQDGIPPEGIPRTGADKSFAKGDINNLIITEEITQKDFNVEYQNIIDGAVVLIEEIQGSDYLDNINKLKEIYVTLESAAKRGNNDEEIGGALQIRNEVSEKIASNINMIIVEYDLGKSSIDKADLVLIIQQAKTYISNPTTIEQLNLQLRKLES